MELKEAFTFETYRRKVRVGQKNTHNISLYSNQGDIENEVAKDRLRFVLAQLARFGIIERVQQPEVNL